MALTKRLFQCYDIAEIEVAFFKSISLDVTGTDDEE